MSMREEFEKWAEELPYEFNLERFGENGSWPGDYRSYPVQCAWNAYQDAYLAGAKAMQEEAAQVGMRQADNGIVVSSAIRAINPENLK